MGKIKKASKKHWKKVQHADVDEFLDTEREKERHDFSRHDNASLFRIDTNNTEDSEAKPESDTLVDFTKLKCFELLKPLSNVRDPLIKRNKVRNNTRLQSKHKNPTAPQNSKLTNEEQLQDPWTDNGPSSTTELSEWLTVDALRVNSSIKKKRNAHKPSELSAIEIPHPGFSVNPSFQDHQDLLKAALAKEVTEIRKEEKINRAVAFPKTSNIKQEEENLKFFLGTIEDDKSGEEDNSDEEKERKPLLSKPKTRQQRRKEKELKEKERIAGELKKVKTRESEVFQIKKINKQIDKIEASRKSRMQEKLAKKSEYEKYGQKELGKYKFTEPKLNPLLSEEVNGSLVGAKTVNNAEILLDRFKSLQKRNILEVRKKSTTKRKHKLKKFTRPVDRMEWERTGMWKGMKVT